MCHRDRLLALFRSKDQLLGPDEAHVGDPDERSSGRKCGSWESIISAAPSLYRLPRLSMTMACLPFSLMLRSPTRATPDQS